MLKNILLYFFAIVFLGGLTFFFYIQNPDFIPSTINSINEKLETPEPDPFEGYYINDDYKFRFLLLEGEEIVECLNQNEHNDNTLVGIVAKKGTLGKDEICESQVEDEYIFANKKFLYDETPRTYINNRTKANYDVETEDYLFAGEKGIRVLGRKKENSIADVPLIIDQVVVQRDGIIYVLTPAFYDREFDFLK